MTEYCLQKGMGVCSVDTHTQYRWAGGQSGRHRDTVDSQIQTTAAGAVINIV
jgi:hypothetical protein